MYKKVKKKGKRKNKKNAKIFIIPCFIILFILSYVEVENIFNINIMIRDFFYAKYHDIDDNVINITFNSELQKSLDELKKLLDIKMNLSDFEITYASVIERSNISYIDSFVINKGSVDGIEDGMAVVDSQGLIGTISKTGLYTSNVMLVTNPSKFNNISVEIVGEERVNKTLKVLNNELVIEGINKKAKLGENDKVITNGLSNKYPSGILIGYIRKLQFDNNYLYKNAIVKLSSNIDNIKYVAVLKRSIK